MFYDELTKLLGPAETDSDLETSFTESAGVIRNLFGPADNLNHLSVTNWAVRHYQVKGLAEILKEANAHREKFARQGSLHEAVLVLTHPFYDQAHTLHMVSSLSKEEQEESRGYQEKLLDTLQRIRGSGISVVIVESPEGYAAASRVLHERGLVDDVIFTQYSVGYALDKDEYERLSGASTIYAGGMYVDSCLSTALKQQQRILDKADFLVVPELVYHPQRKGGGPVEQVDPRVDFVPGVSEKRVWHNALVKLANQTKGVVRVNELIAMYPAASSSPLRALHQ